MRFPAAVALLALLATASTAADRAALNAEQGDPPAAEFLRLVRDDDGKPVSLDSLRGRPLLVHYWATWCEPCKVDMAQIRELAAKYGPKKFAVVGIALDSDKQQLEKFLKSKPIAWPQLHEAGGLDGRLAEELGVLTLPTMILLDAEGKVVDRNVVITELEKKIDALLEGK